MNKDDYVKIIGVDGNYRYGYIADIKDRGDTMVISLFDEGESKLAYDNAYMALRGEEPVDWVSRLTDIEKRIVPMLAGGLNTNDIALALSISPTTVRAHIRTLRIKLHLDDRAQLIAFSGALESMIKQNSVDQAIASEATKRE